MRWTSGVLCLADEKELESLDVLFLYTLIISVCMFVL